MPDERTRIDLTVLLPDVPDAQDACVRRLREVIGREQGVVKTHLLRPPDAQPALCLHYDPSVLSLAHVQRLARAAGAGVTEHLGHAGLPMHAIDGEDSARRIEAALRAMPGVLSASVNLAAQRAGVEFDRGLTSVERIAKQLRRLGYPGRAGRPDWYARNKELAWSGAAGLLAVLAFAGQHAFGWPALGVVTLYLVAYGFGAFDLLRHM